jgi:hypothetical protein
VTCPNISKHPRILLFLSPIDEHKFNLSNITRVLEHLQ